MGFDFKSERLQEDARYLEWLIGQGVLTQMSPELFPGTAGENGALIMMCSDGDQQQHLLMNHWAMCSGRYCHHVIATNGLGLRIARNSPVASSCEHELWLADAVTAARIKGLHTMVIYGHWPCGVAEASQLPINAQLKLYAVAKEELSEHFKSAGIDMKIIIGLQIDHGTQPRPFKGVYHLNRHARANKSMLYSRQ